MRNTLKELEVQPKNTMEYMSHGINVKEGNSFYFFYYPKNSSSSEFPEPIQIRKVTVKIKQGFWSKDMCNVERLDDYLKIPSNTLERFPAFLFTCSNSPNRTYGERFGGAYYPQFACQKDDCKMKIQYLGESVSYADPSKAKKGWKVYEVPQWNSKNMVPCKRLCSNFMKVGNKGYLYGGFVTCKAIDFYNKEGDWCPELSSTCDQHDNKTLNCLVNDLWEFDFVQESWKLLIPLELRPIDEFESEGTQDRLFNLLKDEPLKMDLDTAMISKKVTTAPDSRRSFVNYRRKSWESDLFCLEYNFYGQITLQAFDEVSQRIIYVGRENFTTLQCATVTIFDCKEKGFVIYPLDLECHRVRFSDNSICHDNNIPTDVIYNPVDDSLLIQFSNYRGNRLESFDFETGSLVGINWSQERWEVGSKCVFLDDKFKSIARFHIDTFDEVKNSVFSESFSLAWKAFRYQYPEVSEKSGTITFEHFKYHRPRSNARNFSARCNICRENDPESYSLPSVICCSDDDEIIGFNLF